MLAPRVSVLILRPLAGRTRRFQEATPFSTTRPRRNYSARPQDQYSLTTLYNPDGTVQSGPAATVFTIDPRGLQMPRYQNWSLGLEQMLPEQNPAARQSPCAGEAAWVHLCECFKPERSAAS